MKKTITLLLAMAMLSSVVMTACSDAADNAGSSSDASTVNTTPEAGAENVEEEAPQDFYSMSDLPRDLNLDGYEARFSLEEGGNGAGLATYCELMINMATKANINAIFTI